MLWRTGRFTSYPDDGRAFLEKGLDELWRAYRTDAEGRCVEGFPLLIERAWEDVQDAQKWVESNVPPTELSGLARPL